MTIWIFKNKISNHNNHPVNLVRYYLWRSLCELDHHYENFTTSRAALWIWGKLLSPLAFGWRRLCSLQGLGARGIEARAKSDMFNVVVWLSTYEQWHRHSPNRILHLFIWRERNKVICTESFQSLAKDWSSCCLTVGLLAWMYHLVLVIRNVNCNKERAGGLFMVFIFVIANQLNGICVMLL